MYWTCFVRYDLTIRIFESMYKEDRQMKGFWNTGTLDHIVGTSSWLVLSQKHRRWGQITCSQTLPLNPSTAKVRVGWLKDRCLTRYSNSCLSAAWALRATWLSAYNTPFFSWSFISLSFPTLWVFIPILLWRTIKNIHSERSSYFRACVPVGYY